MKLKSIKIFLFKCACNKIRFNGKTIFDIYHKLSCGDRYVLNVRSVSQAKIKITAFLFYYQLTSISLSKTKFYEKLCHLQNLEKSQTVKYQNVYYIRRVKKLIINESTTTMYKKNLGSSLTKSEGENIFYTKIKEMNHSRKKLKYIIKDSVGSKKT